MSRPHGTTSTSPRALGARAGRGVTSLVCALALLAAGGCSGVLHDQVAHVPTPPPSASESQPSDGAAGDGAADADGAPSGGTGSPQPGMAPLRFGAFTYGGVWQGMGSVHALEDDLGRRLDVVHWFTNWDNPFYPEMVAAVADGGRAPLISWQPHRQRVQDIAAGVHDDYVRAWARGVAAAPGLVYVRPFPEMNGDWVPWNGEPDLLREAWRRIAGMFEEEGATNVRWVFGPNVTDSPRTAENALERYYPGDDVVDVLALSGYNWGASRPAIGWRDVQTVFRSGYDRVAALGPQDVWLAETASADEGGDKAAWVRELFSDATRSAFPRMTMVVWFDQLKEADWRIRSRPEVLDAFRDALRAVESTLGAHGPAPQPAAF